MTEKVITILKEFTKDMEINLNTNIIQVLDSLSLISFILNVEDEVEVELDLDSLDVSVLESVEIFSNYLTESM